MSCLGGGCVSILNEFEGFIEQFGFKVLITKQDKEARCPHCWDVKTQSTRPNCEVCFGTGYVSIVEEHKVRGKTASIPQSLPRQMMEAPYGTEPTPARFFYVKRDVIPSYGDIIFDTTEDSIYQVNSIEKFRLRDEIIYYRLATTSEGIKSADAIKTNMLNAFGGDSNG